MKQELMVQEVTDSKALNLSFGKGSNGLNPMGIDLASSIERDFRVIVDPTCAQWFLDNMHDRQRDPSAREVAKFERLMASGKFVAFHEPGIVVHQNGKVCNARHRLTAQRNRGLTFGWKLKIGVSDEYIAALDQTRSRRNYESARLVGEALDKRSEAVIKLFMMMLRARDGRVMIPGPKFSVEEIIDTRDEFSKALVFALDALPPRAGPAALVSAIAYAHPIAPSTIEFFADAFIDTRLAQQRRRYPKNHPAVVLARLLITNTGAGGQYQKEIMYKSLSALRAHLQDRECARLFANEDVLKWFQAERTALGIDRRSYA